MPRRNKQSNKNRLLTDTSACRGKKRYASRGEAVSAIEYRSKLLDDGVILGTYRCPNCQGWHLTSTTRS